MSGMAFSLAVLGLKPVSMRGMLTEPRRPVD
jgi:hypothetical protein